MFDLRRSDVALLQAVTDCGSLQAVERGGRMTQSSASRRLIKLERRLRTPLVSRGSTGAELTEAGHALLHVGGRLLAAVDFAIATAHHAADAADRLPVVQFAVATDCAYGLDRDLAADFPDVVFDVMPGDSHDVWQRLERCAADAAYGWETSRRPVERRSGVLVRTIAEEPQWIALPAGHSLTEHDLLDLRDLAGAEWVAVVGGDSGDDQGWALSRLTPTPRVTFTVRSQGAALGLVERGYGIALVSPFARPWQSDSGLVLRPLRQKLVRRLSLAVDPLAVPVPLAQDLWVWLRRRYMLRMMRHHPMPPAAFHDDLPDATPRTAPHTDARRPPVLLSELHWSTNGPGAGFEAEHLHLLRVIDRTGSLNRAAAALLVTQPALTRRIHRLEAGCGLSLVHSTARGTELSAGARRLLVCTGPAQRRLDALVNRLRRGTPAGRRRPGGEAWAGAGVASDAASGAAPGARLGPRRVAQVREGTAFRKGTALT